MVLNRLVPRETLALQIQRYDASTVTGVARQRITDRSAAEHLRRLRTVNERLLRHPAHAVLLWTPLGDKRVPALAEVKVTLARHALRFRTAYPQQIASTLLDSGGNAL
ncbi:hypothetical protein GCM10022270_24190 [Terriglobus aquaticus]